MPSNTREVLTMKLFRVGEQTAWFTYELLKSTPEAANLARLGAMILDSP